MNDHNNDHDQNIDTIQSTNRALISSPGGGNNTERQSSELKIKKKFNFDHNITI